MRPTDQWRWIPDRASGRHACAVARQRATGAGRTGAAFLFGVVGDITEASAPEEERSATWWFLESMEPINRRCSARTTGRHDKRRAEKTLAIFGSGRAWLSYPCDPNAPRPRVVIQHTRSEYPGAGALGGVPH